MGNISIDEGSISERNGLTRLAFNLSGDVFVSGQVVSQINASSSFLLPLDLVEKAGGYVLIYDIGDRISLSKYLRINKSDISMLLDMLKNINASIGLCRDKQLYSDNLSFNTDHIFCGASPSDIRFVYFPYETGANGIKSCKAMLIKLLDESSSFEDRNNVSHADKIRDCLKKSDFDTEEFSRVINDIQMQLAKRKPKNRKSDSAAKPDKAAKPEASKPDKAAKPEAYKSVKKDGKDTSEKGSFFKRLFGGGRRKQQPETPEARNLSPMPAPDPTPAPVKRNMTELLISPGSAMTTMMKQDQDRYIQFSFDIQGYMDKIYIDKFPCTVGRSQEDSDILVNDKSVSRKHALVECTDGKYSITDCNSSNGIQLNGSLITPGIPRALKMGDAVKLGRVDMKVTSIGCK